jgi:predicted O-methyltransferase YrrM
MDDRFNRVLSRYSARMADEKALLDRSPEAFDRDKFLLPVGEHVARLLQALIVGRNAKLILELGTSYGYSTLFLADAARQTGGKVVSMDLSPEKQEHARRELADAGLDAFVDLRSGDAVALLDQSQERFDLVLLDIWKDLYVACFEAFRNKLTPNAIIVADNMIYPAGARPDAERYRAAVRGAPEFQTVLLPIGNGIELSCLWRD